MSVIISFSFKCFERLADLMEEKTKREAWLNFLEHLVFHYIQCLLQSCSKIDKKKSVDAIQKIKDDQEIIEYRFSQNMSQRVLKGGIEVLNDIVTIFECNVDFISLPCEKLRRSQGKNFNFKIVTNLMSMRTDFSKVELAEAMKTCKEVLDNYREEEEADPGRIKKNLFE